MPETKDESARARILVAIFLLSVAIFAGMFFVLNFGFLIAIGASGLFFLSAISVMALVNSIKTKLFFWRRKQPGIVKKPSFAQVKELVAKVIKRKSAEIVPLLQPQPESVVAPAVKKVEGVTPEISGTKAAASASSSAAAAGAQQRASSVTFGVVTRPTTISPAEALLPSAKLASTGNAETAVLAPELAKPLLAAGGELLSSSPKKAKPVFALGTIPIASAAVFKANYLSTIEHLIAKKAKDLQALREEKKQEEDKAASSSQSLVQTARKYMGMAEKARELPAVLEPSLEESCKKLEEEIEALKKLKTIEPPSPSLSNISSKKILDMISELQDMDYLKKIFILDTTGISQLIIDSLTLAKKAIELERSTKTLTPAEGGEVVKKISNALFAIVDVKKMVSLILDEERARIDQEKKTVAKLEKVATERVRKKEVGITTGEVGAAEKLEKASETEEKLGEIEKLFDQLKVLEKIMFDKNEYYLGSLEVKLDTKSESASLQPGSKAE